MTRSRNDYADTLAENRILFVPSCIFVEMMTRLHGQIAAVGMAGDPRGVTPNLLILLRRMRHNLRATSEAYELRRIRSFIGDWREEKLRARKLFFHIMSRLGHISELLEPVEKNMLYAAIEEITSEWAALDRVMSGTADGARGGACGACRHFRNFNPAARKRTMANAILALDETAERGDGDRLLLICYERVRTQLLAAIAGIERRRNAKTRFDPERIVAVSGENVAVSCPTCATMADAGGVGDARPHAGGASRPVPGKAERRRISLKKSSEATAAQLKRLAGQPSLAALSPGKR